MKHVSYRTGLNHPVANCMFCGAPIEFRSDARAVVPRLLHPAIAPILAGCSCGARQTDPHRARRCGRARRRGVPIRPRSGAGPDGLRSYVQALEEGRTAAWLLESLAGSDERRHRDDPVSARVDRSGLTASSESVLSRELQRCEALPGTATTRCGTGLRFRAPVDRWPAEYARRIESASTSS